MQQYYYNALNIKEYSIILKATNLPKVTDARLAFEDRTLIVKFPNEFRGKSQIDNIERSWLDNPAEVSGIFNWMLEDLKRLDKNREFTISKTMPILDPEEDPKLAVGF